MAGRINRHLSQKANFPEGQIHKKICTWRPYVILEEHFGQGVFALVPKNMIGCYQKLRSTGKMTKEEKFQFVMNTELIPWPLDVIYIGRRYTVSPIITIRRAIICRIGADLAVPGVITLPLI
jgi:hypothetical protein